MAQLLQRSADSSGADRKQLVSSLLSELQATPVTQGEEDQLRAILSGANSPFTESERREIASALTRAHADADDSKAGRASRRPNQDYLRFPHFLSKQQWQLLQNSRTARDRAEALSECLHYSLQLELPSEQTLATMTAVICLMEGGTHSQFQLHSVLQVVRTAWKSCTKRFSKQGTMGHGDLLQVLPPSVADLPSALRERLGQSPPVLTENMPLSDMGIRALAAKVPLRQTHASVSQGSAGNAGGAPAALLQLLADHALRGQQDPRSPRIDFLPMPASGPSVPEMKAIKDAPSRNPSSDSLGFADKEQALEIVFPKAGDASGTDPAKSEAVPLQQSAEGKLQEVADELQNRRSELAMPWPGPPATTAGAPKVLKRPAADSSMSTPQKRPAASAHKQRYVSSSEAPIMKRPAAHKQGNRKMKRPSASRASQGTGLANTQAAAGGWSICTYVRAAGLQQGASYHEYISPAGERFRSKSSAVQHGFQP